MLGLETALSVVVETLVAPGLITWLDVSRIMSQKPAEIGSLAGYQAPFQVGEPAHLVLVDPTASAVPPRASLSHNNPYRSHSLPGRVLHTLFGGVRTVADGELVEHAELLGKRAEL